MDRRDAPPTEEGWFALHDFRTVDWDAWRAADPETRDRAVESGTDYLAAAEAVEDAEDGASGTYTVVGHKADLLVVHFRPTLAGVNALERRFERTALADVTERAHSYVSVTEASGYTVPEYFEDDDAEIDAGLRRYMESRIRPSIPDAAYVCFYPMDKRRGPDHNWYDLSFEERAEYMSAHGEIGREYAGKVTQVITGSIGLDDWEWGVTLFAKDPAQFKRLLYEMRFDPSSSRFAEFGPFFVGQRLEPDRLGAFFAGEGIGEAATDAGGGTASPTGSDAGSHSGDGAPPHGGTGVGGGDGGGDGETGIRAALADLDVYAGQPHGEDVYAVTLYSEADPDELFEAVSGLRGNFDHYDTHVETAVYEDRAGDRHAVASLWETESAAETAAGFLADLPGVVGRVGEEEEEGWGTMGMFYAVKPEHREDFVETFDEVQGLLAEMDGHRETRLLANHEDENDMFIASLWRSREDAMEFFRSDAFRETVSWGREVLADRPRHVFLA